MVLLAKANLRKSARRWAHMGVYLVAAVLLMVLLAGGAAVIVLVTTRARQTGAVACILAARAKAGAYQQDQVAGLDMDRLARGRQGDGPFAVAAPPPSDAALRAVEQGAWALQSRESHRLSVAQTAGADHRGPVAGSHPERTGVHTLQARLAMIGGRR